MSKKGMLAYLKVFACLFIYSIWVIFYTLIGKINMPVKLSIHKLHNILLIYIYKVKNFKSKV